MRVLFTDLHGHDRALQQLLRQHPQGALSLGDVLGTRGSNARCLELLRACEVPSLQGNHEYCMQSIYGPSLSAADWEWVRQWPLEWLGEDALLTHTLLAIEDGAVDFLRIDRPERVVELLQRRPLVFVGHQHLPGWWSWDGCRPPRWQSALQPLTVELDPEMRYLFQVGSLGEPEGPRLPRYLVWEERQVRWMGLEIE